MAERSPDPTNTASVSASFDYSEPAFTSRGDHFGSDRESSPRKIPLADGSELGKGKHSERDDSSETENVEGTHSAYDAAQTDAGNEVPPPVPTESPSSGDVATGSSGEAVSEISRNRFNKDRIAQERDERRPLIEHSPAPRETVTEFLSAVPGPSAGASISRALNPQGQLNDVRVDSSSGASIQGTTADTAVKVTDTQIAQPVERSPITSHISTSHSSGGDPGRRQGATGLSGGSDVPYENTELRSSQQRSREASDIVLPRWQPDAEVTYCPICSTQFSFFVRKHHCRKCGRVVCNACSPHRITIPYQFIVQPPPSAYGDTTDTWGPLGGLTERHGGMKVRLCNPCVPDPNTLPPRTNPGEDSWRDAPPTYYLNSGNRPITFDEEGLSNFERESGLTSPNQRDSLSNRARGMSAASGLTAAERRQDPRYGGRYGGLISEVGTGSYPNPSSPRMSARNELQGPSRPTRLTYYGNPSQSRGHASRHQSLSVSSTGATNPQPHYRSLLDMVNDTHGSLLSSDQRPLPPIPRIPEEDECPICHRELVPRTLPDFESVRAAHVMKCIDDQIAAHSGQGPRPGAYTSASQPGPASNSSTPLTAQQPLGQTTATPPPETQSSRRSTLVNSPGPTVPGSSRPIIPTPIANTPEARMAAREQAHAAVVFAASQSPSAGNSVRRTGMFPYKATEKDCVDDAECTICLEEFEVGVPMARLECLCRFHRGCIQEWFVNHPGRCPVHQHDGHGF